MINRMNNTTINAKPAPYPPVGALINKHLHVYLLVIYEFPAVLSGHLSWICKNLGGWFN